MILLICERSDNIIYKQDLLEYYEKVGELAQAMSNSAKEEEAYLNSVRVAEQLDQECPSDETKQTLRKFYGELADFYTQQGNSSLADEYLNKKNAIN